MHPYFMVKSSGIFSSVLAFWGFWLYFDAFITFVYIYFDTKNPSCDFMYHLLQSLLKQLLYLIIVSKFICREEADNVVFSHSDQED